MTARSMYDKNLKERAEFLAWLRKNVSQKYLKMTETEDCFSPIRNFQTIDGLSFQEKQSNLAVANTYLSRKFYHVFGNKKNPCERCLRVINASALFHSIYHSELLTKEADKIIAGEKKQREIEHKNEHRGYRTDRLYLIQIKVPFETQWKKDIIYHSHLIFYDESSIKEGKDAFRTRTRDFPFLSVLNNFDNTGKIKLLGLDADYYSVKSEIKNKAGEKTLVEIISREP